MGRIKVLIARKRRISLISQKAINIAPELHTLVRLPKRNICVYYKGGRFTDRPQKRIALEEIAVQNNKQSARRLSFYGCKKYDIYLCQKRDCMLKYHNNT